VLWTVLLLSLIVTHLLAAGLEESQIAFNMRSNAAAEAEADGAVHEAISRLLNRLMFRQGPPIPESASYRLRLSSGEAEVLVEQQAGKVNPNLASVYLLEALLRQVGADPAAAENLAAAIADWRTRGEQGRPGGAKAPEYRQAGRDYGPPSAPFESLDELGDVLGMSPSLVAALAPHMSLYTKADPVRALADPVVRAALAKLPIGVQENSDESEATQLVMITALVTEPGGSHFQRSAVVSLGVGEGRPFQILTWDAPGL